jgi:hypothetical protein
LSESITGPQVIRGTDIFFFFFLKSLPHLWIDFIVKLSFVHSSVLITESTSTQIRDLKQIITEINCSPSPNIIKEDETDEACGEDEKCIQNFGLTA